MIPQSVEKFLKKTRFQGASQSYYSNYSDGASLPVDGNVSSFESRLNNSSQYFVSEIIFDSKYGIRFGLFIN